jgi:hypothetical protein
MTYRERTRMTLPARHGATSSREETWNQIVQDLWIADDIAAPSADVWLRERYKSGYPDLDRLLAAEAGMVEGFPLRIETARVAATRDLERTRVHLSRDHDSISQKIWIGNGFPPKDIQWTSSKTEVSALEVTTQPIPAERFQPPAGYTRREAER